jgi:3-hydroxyisobutyrate dehydrogenase
MAHIALLGLGAMGSRMAARLIAAGHQVTVWNRSAAAAQALAAQGAHVAALKQLHIMRIM